MENGKAVDRARRSGGIRGLLDFSRKLLYRMAH
jgi:hypothetical protein